MPPADLPVSGSAAVELAEPKLERSMGLTMRVQVVTTVLKFVPLLATAEAHTPAGGAQ
jgi:hypothetical protein